MDVGDDDDSSVCTLPPPIDNLRCSADEYIAYILSCIDSTKAKIRDAVEDEPRMRAVLDRVLPMLAEVSYAMGWGHNGNYS